MKSALLLTAALAIGVQSASAFEEAPAPTIECEYTATDNHVRRFEVNLDKEALKEAKQVQDAECQEATEADKEICSATQLSDEDVIAEVTYLRRHVSKKEFDTVMLKKMKSLKAKITDDGKITSIELLESTDDKKAGQAYLKIRTAPEKGQKSIQFRLVEGAKAGSSSNAKACKAQDL